MTTLRCAGVLASDSAFFYQTRACLKLLLSARGAVPDAVIDPIVVDLGLARADRVWLDASGIAAVARDPRVPVFPDAPDHAYAMTCRPYIPESVPGYDLYLWIDSDLRFLGPAGLAAYVALARRPGCSIALCQESDPAYATSHDPAAAETWLADRWQRLKAIYGRDIAARQRVVPPFNAGLFAAAAGSPVWAAYRARLAQALDRPYDRLREQDALNVAVRDVGGHARLPTTMNWICSLALPWRAPDGSWRHPDHRESPIHVLHLTQSEREITTGGRTIRTVEFYRSIGLPV
ncbi:MAG: hypothetical protein AB7O45_00020 [Alphaproteobacteria bacterium]